MSGDRRVTCHISLVWTDGDTMYDDDYEVCGRLEYDPGGNGWAPGYNVYDVVISAPGGTVEGSRAIPELLPSSWLLEAEDALEERACEDWRDSDPDDKYFPEDDR